MIYNERCTIVANQDGSIKTAFVDRMGVDSEGRHYGAGQATIGSDELTQFLGVAHNEALATIARLESDLATKTTEYNTTKEALDAKTIELEDHASEKAKLIEDHAAAIDALKATNTTQTETINQQANDLSEKESLLVSKNNQIETLGTENAALQTQITSLQQTSSEAIDVYAREVVSLQASVAFLNSIRTYDPNRIKSEAFYERISGDERFQLGVLALTDDTAKAILAKLDDYLKNKWEVLLDDPEVVQPLQYLLGTGVLVEERITQITKPASRDEAYIPPQPTKEPSNES